MPVLLLHGDADYLETWTYQFPVLSEEFHLIAPDMRGHGRTTDSDKLFTYEQFATDLAAFLKVKRSVN